MPRQLTYITVPAVLEKGDIAKYAQLQGKANSASYVVKGETYPAGMLKFATFAGSLVDGLYRGVYQFEPGVFEEANRADFNELPNDADKHRKTKKKIEHTEAT